MTEIVFTVKPHPRGDLVTCVIDGEIGSARVFSAGLDEAKQRAQAQAEAKLKAKRAGS